MYTCEVDPSRKLGIVRYGETFTADVLIRALRDLLGDPDWKAGYNFLADARSVRQTIISPDDLAGIVDELITLHEQLGQRRAAIVVSRELDDALARLFIKKTEHDGTERRVFYSFQRALAWLEGVDEPRRAPRTGRHGIRSNGVVS